MKRSSSSAELLNNYATTEPSMVMDYDCSYATGKEIIFVLSRLELLKGLSVESEQKAAITQELLRHNVTRRHLLDRYEALLSETSFNRLSVDNFLGMEATDRVRIFHEARRMIEHSIDKFKRGITDDEIEALKIDTMSRLRDDFLTRRYRMIGQFEKEFLEAVNVDWEKVGFATERVENQLQSLIGRIREKQRS